MSDVFDNAASAWPFSAGVSHHQTVSEAEELDDVLTSVLANLTPASIAPDSDPAELVRLAAALRDLPRLEFKMRLKTELEWVAAARPFSSDRQSQAEEAPDILPTLFGKGYGTYPVRRSNFAISAAVHGIAMVLILGLGLLAFKGKPRQIPLVVTGIDTLGVYVPPAGNHRPHGGGGGGDEDKLNASRGRLPQAAPEQRTPPVVVVRNSDPKLSVQPTIIAPNLQLPQINPVGDRLSALTTPSNGTGVRSGVGAGSGGGLGPGHGPGFDPGEGGNYGDRLMSLGAGVTAPRVIYDPEPEYSSEARAAKYQGTVILHAIIAPDGRPHAIQIAHPLGMGLDEKAIEALNTWRFEPARKNGQAVPVMIEIYVSFHLY